MTLKMIKNRVMVKPLETPREINGVALPETVSEDFKFCEGTVLSAHPASGLFSGQKVIFDRGAPRVVHVPDLGEVRILNAGDVKAIVTSAGLLPTKGRILARFLDETDVRGIALPDGVRYNSYRTAEVVATEKDSSFEMREQIVLDERLAAEVRTQKYGVFFAIREEYVVASLGGGL